MMIQHPAFPVEPWAVRETELDFERLAQTESVFSLSNGHIGLRGNLDEGEPFGLPGTYLNGLYEVRDLPYAEAGYGFPEDGQTVVNATNGKIIRLLVADEPLDLRDGALRSHERTLDLRDGVLRREAVWISPSHLAIRVRSIRLVSFVQRAVAAILYEVEPLDEAVPVVVQSELIANESLPQTRRDPRVQAALKSPLQAEFASFGEHSAILGHATTASGLRMAAAMDHVIEGPPGTDATTDGNGDLARVTISADLEPGRPLRLVKFLAYGWSQERSASAIHDQVAAALEGARHTGWSELATVQRDYLDDYWGRADVEIDGDTALQQAVRFALFQTLQAGARSEQQAIPAKGLTGPGYDGHTFWDTETFVLPVLTYTAPDSVADALRWRHSTLDEARARAQQLGLTGAAFPWRTISGKECSGYWPAGTAAFHINADIADAVVRYVAASDDYEFEREVGVELLVETARLWRNLGHHDASGAFRIDGVTGPDEYSAIADNNVYTNLMAQRNLLAAADAAARFPSRAATLGVDAEETAAWRDAAHTMLIPYDSDLGVHPQAEGFLEHERWAFDSTSPDQYPLLLHFPYFSLYRKQVVKQADLVLAMHLRGDAFTVEEKARNFAYYEELTVRDSSLSACTQAVIAAELGHLALAYDYTGEAARMDLDDLEQNTRDGLHIAALAGSWISVVAGFGGMREHDGSLSFSPRLPQTLTKLRFRLMYRGRRLLVELDQDAANYSLLAGEPLAFLHYGEERTMQMGEPITCELPEPPTRVPPKQPPGRAPARRREQ